MSKIIRAVSLMLTLLITVGMFAGCGGENNESSKKQGGTEVQSMGLPKIDIKSDTVKWLCWNDQAVLDNENTELGFINRLMKDKYGCSIKVVKTSYEELTQKAVQLILSGDAPDMAFFKAADFPNFILNGIVDDVSKHIDTSDKFWSYLDENPYKYQGVNYNCFTGTAVNGMTYYNTKMFKNAGLETPYQLFKKGDWTWEKMFELAKKLTQDTNKDGTADIYGCKVSPLYFYPTCGDDFVKVNDDGTFTNNIRSANIAKVMNFMYNLQQAGYNGGDVWQGTAAMLVDEAWQTTAYGDKLGDGTIGIAPSPKMDKDSDWYVNGSASGEWLCKGAKNPGGVMAYMAILRWIGHDSEGIKIHKEFQKKTFKYTDEVNEVLEWLEDAKNTKQILARTQGVGNFGQANIFKMFNDTCAWGVPWSTNTEAMYPVLQTQIDTVNVKLATKDDF